MIKGKGQRLIPEELLKYLEALKKEYPNAVNLVEANPTLEGGEDSLSSVLINGIKYAVGGGSEVHLYHHHVFLRETDTKFLVINIISTSNIAYTYSTLYSYIRAITNNALSVEKGYPCLSTNGGHHGYSCCTSSSGYFYSNNYDGTDAFYINLDATIFDTITEV